LAGWLLTVFGDAPLTENQPPPDGLNHPAAEELKRALPG
jgi:hypothetical protein